MKFINAWKKGDGIYFLKIALDDGKEKWMNTSETVYNFAKSNFKDGDEIGVEYTQKNGQYNVTRINKDGKSAKQESTPAETKKQEPTKSETIAKYTCIDCGKELKDDKYKKCFMCNKKNPAPKDNNSNYSGKSSDVQDSITTQSAYKIAAIALQVFTGQISDLEVLKAQLDDLAKHLKVKF